MANEGALANLDDDAVIAEISDGVMLKQIAARYGVVKSSLHKRISKHPEYKDAVANQAHSFVERAMEQVFECDADTANIARARVDAAFKYARAHNPDYADKSSATITVVDIAAVIAEARQRALGATMGATQQLADGKVVSDQ
jgi:hypothetical protein